MEGYLTELILIAVGSTLLAYSLAFVLTTVGKTNVSMKSIMLADSFSDAINYLFTAYDGAEYTVVNTYMLDCGLKYGFKNFTTEKNVPYVEIYCPGNVERTFYHVKLAVNSTGVLNTRYIYVYRVAYDGNLTIYVRT